MQFTEQNRDGCQASVDGSVGAAGPILYLHKSEAICPGDDVRWLEDRLKEDLKVVSIADPSIIALVILIRARK